jgi:hypothetical protein
MSQHLVIQLGAVRVDAESPVPWYLFGANGALERGGATPLGLLRAEVGPSFEDGQTVVLVPGELIFLTSAHIP